ncbi:MAG: hypothetical protein FD126_2055 [Elusimicrobia bacterium]|nr:MAG: hypothetical protein FD126_2055 [Elusimicrobiota bacterium]
MERAFNYYWIDARRPRRAYRSPRAIRVFVPFSVSDETLEQLLTRILSGRLDPAEGRAVVIAR